jgi:Flp pilus assembly pilin Flp
MQARFAYVTFEAIERVKGLVRREEGQSAVEYGVILALILAVSIAVIGFLGVHVQSAFQAVCKPLNGNVNC